MKTSSSLLKYINYYRYIYEIESIYFEDRPKKAEAIDAYFQFAEDHHMKGDHPRLWMYAVALDCIRTMPKQERERLLAVEDIDMLHFDYGMYIRNHYIYRSRLYGTQWDADELSHMAIDLMLTILRPTPQAH